MTIVGQIKLLKTRKSSIRKSAARTVTIEPVRLVEMMTKGFGLKRVSMANKLPTAKSIRNSVISFSGVVLLKL